MNNKNAAAGSDSILAGCIGTGTQVNKVLYGLPCANCRSYYESNLTSCPICRCSDRIAPQSALTRLTAVL